MLYYIKKHLKTGTKLRLFVTNSENVLFHFTSGLKYGIIATVKQAIFKRSESEEQI